MSTHQTAQTHAFEAVQDQLLVVSRTKLVAVQGDEAVVSEAGLARVFPAAGSTAIGLAGETFLAGAVGSVAAHVAQLCFVVVFADVDSG